MGGLAGRGCYLLIGLGVVGFGRDWAAPWLLRMPAAAAIGIIALISFLPGGWLYPPLHGWVAAAVLGGAAFGYLVVEVRNHGVAGLRCRVRWPWLVSGRCTR